MRLSFVILALSCWHDVAQLALANDLTLTRRADGDVFTIPDSCNEACMELSSDTASPFGSSSFPSAANANNSCTCQCNYPTPVFREDLRICVDNIQECESTGFASASGVVEKVPYVLLPQYGQIVYPDAEIKFEEAESPVCVVTGVQQLGPSGWSELRNVSHVELPLSLYRDSDRTFLQWTGDSRLRELAEGKIVVVKLACRDSYRATLHRGVFTPCLAFRIAGSPIRSNIKEVSFSASDSAAVRIDGLTSSDYAAIGAASALLALVYLASVSLYLCARKSRRNSREQQQQQHQKRQERRRRSRDDLEAVERHRQHQHRHHKQQQQHSNGVEHESEDNGPRVKCNPLLAVGSRHCVDSDDNLSGGSEVGEPCCDKPSSNNYNNSETETDDDPNNSPSATSCAVTSAVVHPHEDYNDGQEQSCNSGALVGERLPEEDVRVVETTESGNHGQQQGPMPVFPGTQRRKLYFNPAYFDRSLLLAPPPAAIEFLLKIREVISIAKHKMAAKRFIPTLNEIPEERSSLERSSDVASGHRQQQQGRRRRSSSAQGTPRRQQQQQQQQLSGRCDGCPGCGGRFSSTPDLAQLHQSSRSQRAPHQQQHLQGIDPALSGESRVRAWLEDVKLIDARWRQLQQHQQPRNATRASHPGAEDSHGQQRVILPKGISSRSLPPIFREASRGIGRDSLANYSKGRRDSDEDRPRVLALQTSGSSDESRSGRSRSRERVPINANPRLSIENSFREQIEQHLQRNGGCVRSDDNNKLGEFVRSNADKIRAQLEISRLQSLNGANDGMESSQMEDTRVLLSIINDELSSRSSDEAKRIMDAVIQELAVSKDKDKNKESNGAINGKASDYETDSLEKARASRKSSSSPVLTEKSSPAQSSVLPMDEELTMRNAMIDLSIGNDSVRTNGCNGVGNKHNLPEVVPLQQQQNSEHYALVSEVYVNDGYASPSNSDDDSGPEIQYEPENPGHLTIRVLDSPRNYVKQDESEYEPDTLDRKPMKLKINGDITYERQDVVNEVFVDSLERSSQILLKSRSSFRRDDASSKPSHEYNSLREIYEARIKHQQQHQQLQMQRKQNHATALDENGTNETCWAKSSCKCSSSPLLPRQERRQRKADNQPDVVPKPPPPPPPPDTNSHDHSAKNAQDRSFAVAGDPTICEGASVATQAVSIVGKSPSIGPQSEIISQIQESTAKNNGVIVSENLDMVYPLEAEDETRRSEKRQQYRRFSAWRSKSRSPTSPARPGTSCSSTSSSARHHQRQHRRHHQQHQEDSAYVSSPESNSAAQHQQHQRRHQHRHHRRRRRSRHHQEEVDASKSEGNEANSRTSGCTESCCSDESGSASSSNSCSQEDEGNTCHSESGAESVGTDSVFFGKIDVANGTANSKITVGGGADADGDTGGAENEIRRHRLVHQSNAPALVY